MIASQLNDKIMWLLQIRTAEKELVSRCLLLSFLIGCILTYIVAVPMGIFLSSYSSKDLPMIYIASAICSTVIGVIYSFFEQRISFSRLIIGLTLVMGIIITLLWFGLVTVGNKISIALIVWALVAIQLYEFALWVVYNRIYTLQQGKRLFGILSMTQAFGSVIAGFTLPVLIHLINIKQVILLIGVITFICIWFYASLECYHTKNDGENDRQYAIEDSKQKGIPIKTIFSNRYVLKIFAMTALIVSVFYTIDLLFNTSAEARYPNEASLTLFLGFFYGTINVVSMVVSGIIYSRIMERFGVIICLMVLPFITGLLALVLIAANLIPPLIAVIFWLIANLSLMNQSLIPSIYVMARLLLMQPFLPDLRAAVQSKNETLIIPLSTLVIGFILMIISKTVGIHVLMFALMVFGFSSLAILIIFSLRSNYVHALNKAIANRYYNSDIKIHHLDKHSWEVLNLWLSSQYADEVVYALNTIEKIDDKKYNYALGLVLKLNQNAIVRKFVLKKIHEYQFTHYFPNILSIIEGDEHDSVRAKALESLAILDYQQAHTKIQCLLDDPSLLVVRAAMIAIFRYSDPSAQKKALDRLNLLHLSEEATSRKTCTYIIGEINSETGNHLLKQLVNDKSKSVRGEALTAVLKTQTKDLIDDLITHIDLVVFSRQHLHYFLKLKDLISAKIKEQFPTNNRLVNLKLLYILGRLNTRDAQDVLENTMLNGSGELKQVALKSYIKMSPEINQNFLDCIHDEIIKQALKIEEDHQDLVLTPALESTQLLRDNFQRRINLSLERLILLLTIYYKNNLIEKAQIAFEMGEEIELSYALELLQSSMSAQHKKIVTPILNKVYLSEPTLSQAMNFDEAVLRRNLRWSDDEPLTQIACVASIYIIKTAEIKSLYQDLELLRNSNSVFIGETLDWLDNKKGSVAKNLG